MDRRTRPALSLLCWGYQVTTHSEVSAGSTASAGSAASGADARLTDDRLLTAMLDGMDAALFAVDTTGRVTHWNRQAERLLGWGRDQAVGREGLGGWVVRPADAADVTGRLLSVLGQPPGAPPGRQVHEFPLVRRDGARVLVRAQTTPVRDADGRAAGVCCVFSEVHAQLELERNLALSHALLTGSGWAVVVVDADLRTVAVNDRATEALAVTSVDMLGEPLAEFFGAGLEQLESALEHALAGHPPEDPAELWLTLLDDGTREDPYGDPVSALPGGPRRCLLSGFVRLASPLSQATPAPLGVAWIFQDVTRSRLHTQDAARRRFRDDQLARAARAAAECPDPLEAAGLHLHYALPGFADHALLDLAPAGPAGPLTRVTESPGGCGQAPGRLAVRYRPGHPALQALERGVSVRATGGLARSAWAVDHRWPAGMEHALCVVLRSRGRTLGVVTFLRGASRRSFDRSDAAYGEDVAVRVAAAADLHLAACRRS
jgi:PAS domain S-box-containing protein